MKNSINCLIATTLLGIVVGTTIIAGCGTGDNADTFKGEPASVPTRDPNEIKPGDPQNRKNFKK